ncbi:MULTISPECIES: hypothetical protein [unclassified Variovorax]|uniref:hypothetical protein n=1 Tax=unclassified Variovorax TaxID=663243 RepID=UPI000BE39D58|nr:hypothetical protein [Variovorax sp. YR752]
MTIDGAVLITSGSSDIGLMLARRLAGRGSRVIICGRGAAALVHAKPLEPSLASKRASTKIKDAIESGDSRVVAISAQETAEFAVRLPELFLPDSKGGVFSGAKDAI